VNHLQTRWGAIEADFQRYYGIDLRVEFSDTPLRRLWVLLDGLPNDAAVWRKEFAWSVQDEMKATQLEQADMWFRNVCALLGAKRSSLPRALNIPRPGDKPAEAKKLNVSDVSQFFTRNFN
jgi:hypothetical protein